MFNPKSSFVSIKNKYNHNVKAVIKDHTVKVLDFDSSPYDSVPFLSFYITDPLFLKSIPIIDLYVIDHVYVNEELYLFVAVEGYDYIGNYPELDLYVVKLKEYPYIEQQFTHENLVLNYTLEFISKSFKELLNLHTNVSSVINNLDERPIHFNYINNTFIITYYDEIIYSNNCKDWKTVSPNRDTEYQYHVMSGSNVSDFYNPVSNWLASYKNIHNSTPVFSTTATISDNMFICQFMDSDNILVTTFNTEIKSLLNNNVIDNKYLDIPLANPGKISGLVTISDDKYPRLSYTNFDNKSSFNTVYNVKSTKNLLKTELNYILNNINGDNETIVKRFDNSFEATNINIYTEQEVNSNNFSFTEFIPPSKYSGYDVRKIAFGDESACFFLNDRDLHYGDGIYKFSELDFKNINNSLFIIHTDQYGKIDTLRDLGERERDIYITNVIYNPIAKRYILFGIVYDDRYKEIYLSGFSYFDNGERCTQFSYGYSDSNVSYDDLLRISSTFTINKTNESLYYISYGGFYELPKRYSSEEYNPDLSDINNSEFKISDISSYLIETFPSYKNGKNNIRIESIGNFNMIYEIGEVNALISVNGGINWQPYQFNGSIIKIENITILDKDSIVVCLDSGECLTKDISTDIYNDFVTILNLPEGTVSLACNSNTIYLLTEKQNENEPNASDYNIYTTVDFSEYILLNSEPFISTNYYTDLFIVNNVIFLSYMNGYDGIRMSYKKSNHIVPLIINSPITSNPTINPELLIEFFSGLESLLVEFMVPVGYIYTWYPNKKLPQELWGGTWIDITDQYADSLVVTGTKIYEKTSHEQ